MADEPAFWTRPVDATLAGLRTSLAGLSADEAADRLRTWGRNTMRAERGHPTLDLLVRQFMSPMVMLLLFAAAISFPTGSTSDGLIIVGIVVVTSLLGFFQERGAAHAVERLLALVAVRASVRRDGREVEIPVEEVVPGDVVLLSAGAMVPGDALVVESNRLLVDEATLTGETWPVEKMPGPTPADAPASKRTGALFLGTHVRSGSGVAVVVRTGKATELGEVGRHLERRRPPTEFQRGIERFGYLLLRFTAALVTAIFAVDLLLGRPLLESLMFSVALAVGLVPEMLPAVVTVNLAQGAGRMAARKVIVKRLESIENFGSMDVLCSDKTGTLTEGKVVLDRALSVDGQRSPRVLRLAAENATLQTGFRNPIDEAVHAAAGAFDLSVCRRVAELPYDFVRKRLSVLVDDGAERRIVTKGALKEVLDECRHVEVDGRIVPLVEHDAAIESLFDRLSAEGLRTLGVAYKPFTGDALTDDDEADLVFAGVIAFSDPPKAGVKEVVAALDRTGIALKVITGDNERVAAQVAREVGFAEPVVLSGPELRTMTDEALFARAGDVHVFAEVAPDQKERIILALRRAGFVVGYMGDGINDASALHAADVSISVCDAVDVAREAADIVLLEPDLRVLLDGVREGRRTFANTLKYVYITTSANFGNMLSMAGAALFLPFLPLLPKQILLNNFLSDIPAMTLAGDAVDPELVERPRRWDIGVIRDFTIVFGSVSSLFDFLTFWVLYQLSDATEAKFQTGWFVESVMTELLVLLVMRTWRPSWESRPGRWLLSTTVFVAIVTVALPYSPVAKPLGLVPPTPELLGAVAAITVAYGLGNEIAKRRFVSRALPAGLTRRARRV